MSLLYFPPSAVLLPFRMNPAPYIAGGHTSMFAPEYLSSPGMFVHGPSNNAGTTMSGFDLAGASTSSSHAPVTVGPNPYYGFELGVSPSIQLTSARDTCRNRGECPHCGRRNIGNGQWRFGVVSDKMVCSACGQYEGRTGRLRPQRFENTRRAFRGPRHRGPHA
ncbi:hypothetical protein C8F01DRAFT_1301363 [Mycena amicta]|nr:hypothetical protein C8F01DRAFT_1301363 [Mycena amicta]